MSVDDRVLKIVGGLRRAYPELIVSVVLVGSYLKGRVEADIDLIILYDDLVLRERGLDGDSFEEELEEFLDELAKRNGLGGVKRAGRTAEGERVDLLALSLSRFWQLLEERNPHILNYLEDGLPIVDENFFKYLQKLYKLGVFKLDEKASWQLFERASEKLIQALRVKLLLVASDCYDAIVGSAMALLMREGVKTSPSNVYEEFVKRFVEKDLFDSEMAEWIREIREIRKAVERGEIKDLRNGEIDEWIRRADRFISRVYELMKSSVQ